MKKVITLGVMLLSVGAFSAQAQTTKPTNGVNSEVPRNGVQGTVLDSSSTDSSNTTKTTTSGQNQSGSRRSMNASGSTSQGDKRSMKRSSTSKTIKPQ